MSADGAAIAAVLAAIPQREPFRFIDEILELDDEHVVATHRFTPSADFYRGHFPGDPITPGVILVETMAQAGVAALAIHLFAQNGNAAEPGALRTLFTDAEVEFSGIVRPGERVITTAHKVFFRRRKLRVKAEMHKEDGSLVCAGALAGMGVPR